MITKQTQELYEALRLYAEYLVQLHNVDGTVQTYTPVYVGYFSHATAGLAAELRIIWPWYSLRMKIMRFIRRPNLPYRG